jgi:hypothetical protein
MPPALQAENTCVLWRAAGLRRQNRARVKAEGFQKYKKGNEIRLVANSAVELTEIRDLLARAGIKAGRPFKNANKFRQPVYGREQIAFFLSAVAENKQRQKPPKQDLTSRKNKVWNIRANLPVNKWF